MSKLKTAFGLVRTSTAEQQLESQINALKDKAKEKGYEIKDKDIFAEQISGYDEPDVDRESILKLNEEIQIRHPDAIFIYELSRLTRRATKVSHYIDMLSLQPKIPMYFMDYDVWTLDEKTKKQNDEAIWNLYGGAKSVELERERIKERTSRGRNNKAIKGYFVGHLSDGYYWEYKDGEKIIIRDKDREDVIKTIFKLYVEDEYSTGEIRDYLIENQIPTTNRYRYEHPEKFKGYKDEYKDRTGNINQRKDILWTDSMVSQILTNRWYIGIREYKGEKLQIKDYIIDIDTWNKAQKRLESLRFKTGNTKRQYLLSGLLFCGVCGRKLYGHGDGYSDMYYCSSKEYGTKHKCGLRWVRQESIDAIVLNILKNRAFNEAWKGKESKLTDFFSCDLNEIKKIDSKIKLRSSKIKRIEGEIENQYKAIESLIDKQLSYVDDSRMSSILEGKIRDRKEEISYNQKEITKTKIEIDKLKKEKKFRSSLRTKLSKIENFNDFDNAKLLVHNAIKKIVLYNPDSQSTVLKILYYNDVEDTAIYCPDRLKQNFIFLFQNDIIRYNPDSKLLEFDGYYLICDYHKQELICYNSNDIEIPEIDSDNLHNGTIPLPQWNTPETKKKYLDDIQKCIEFGSISDNDKQLYIDYYNTAVEDKQIWTIEEDIVDWFNKHNLSTYKNSIPVIDYVNLLRKFSLHIFPFKDILPMSERGIIKKNYHDEYIKRYNTGKPSSVPYIEKDADYNSIQIQRKHLYNRKYKILHNKHLTPQQKDEQILRIMEKLEAFKYQLKYLPTNQKGKKLKEKYN